MALLPKILCKCFETNLVYLLEMSHVSQVKHRAQVRCLRQLQANERKQLESAQRHSLEEVRTLNFGFQILLVLFETDLCSYFVVCTFSLKAWVQFETVFCAGNFQNEAA